MKSFCKDRWNSLAYGRFLFKSDLLINVILPGPMHFLPHLIMNFDGRFHLIWQLCSVTNDRRDAADRLSLAEPEVPCQTAFFGSCVLRKESFQVGKESFRASINLSRALTSSVRYKNIPSAQHLSLSHVFSLSLQLHVKPSSRRRQSRRIVAGRKTGMV